MAAADTPACLPQLHDVQLSQLSILKHIMLPVHPGEIACLILHACSKAGNTAQHSHAASARTT